MTPRGFGRTFAWSLAGLCLALGLPCAITFARPAARPSWWQIRLTVTVSGGYALKGGGVPISGEYTCRAQWLGSLEVDGDDFLLYHFKTEILDWRLAEKAVRPGGETVLEEKDAADKPDLRLNYVLKDGKNIEVDFNLMGIPVPLHPFPVKVGLEFPGAKVREALFEGSSYADFVIRGSNRIVLPGSDLLRPSAERKFNWEWRRERRVPAGTGTALMTERHTAEAVVSLVAH